MVGGLPVRWARVLAFVGEYSAECGYGPSVRDIQDACGFFSTSSVVYALKGLERMGYVTRQREVARSIRLVGAQPPRSVSADELLGELLHAFENGLGLGLLMVRVREYLASPGGETGNER